LKPRGAEKQRKTEEIMESEGEKEMRRNIVSKGN
jgi:hypothetical protein